MSEPAYDVFPIREHVRLGPEIFRRRLSHRYVEQAIQAIETYAEAARLEFQVSAEAGFYEIAQAVAAKIHRPDLVREFSDKRDESVRLAQTAKPMRRRQKKA